ncbi:uncharacterized protein LOC132753549 [Ruditapes philippinarum]|uniref:uncharacterized protein LOC132753549 n=1 Tax=Ruditapes philippinarum TaxID=129788 RepID=UPI00295B8CBA|nr:uncharacterized protein LOC132753549 [Ruditapes philippinarum]
MCSLPQRPSPLKTGCYETSLARSHSQQPVPATVHTSTTPARSTSTPSVRDCASATSTSVTGTPRSEAAQDIRMFTLMEAMSRRQVELLETMNQVLGIVSKMAKVEGVRSSEKPENLNLPASTSEELEALEAELEEGECFNGLVSYLSVQGGVSTTDMVRRVMRQCLTNQLAVQFNWFGKKGKRAFGKLKLAQAVTKAVMKCKKCTAVEVELGCREWFRMASDRDGGRKKRKRPSSSMGESFQD